MKEWLTAAEIAAERLPHMPANERNVQRMAEREGWSIDPFRARKRAGRGGGLEYHIGLLPSLAQIAYRQRHITVGPLPEVAPGPQATLSGRAALERDARLAILTSYAAFERGQRLNRQACEALFVSKYQAGTFAIEAWVRELVPAFSRRTLARWRKAAEEDAAQLGHDRGAARRGTGMLETANAGSVRGFMLALIADRPHLSADHVREQCRAEFGDALSVVRGGGGVASVPMPPLRTFQVALKALRETEKVLITKKSDPDRFRSHMRLSGTGSLRHIGEPNRLWQIDASPIDALCTDGRHTIYVCIDIATRRTTIYVSKTPRAEAVGLLLRKAILAWGVPAEIKTDNGSDFTAKASQRLLISLGIERTLSDAFSPEQKGHVERVIKTFQHDAVALVPGFVGHNVADRKAIEGRKAFALRMGEDDARTFQVSWSAAEMQAHFDAWAELRYGRKPHPALQDRSPAEVAEAAAHTIRRVDLRALDLLLMPIAKGDGTRVMLKTGVHVDHHAYHCGAILPGARVFVRRDPHDLGRVFLFEPDGETFLGEAVNAELAGLPAAALLRAQREVRAETIAARMAPVEAELRKLRRGPALAERARRVWEADAAKAEALKADVIAFPRPEVAHTTPALDAALDAANPVVMAMDTVCTRIIDCMGIWDTPATSREAAAQAAADFATSLNLVAMYPNGRYFLDGQDVVRPLSPSVAGATIRRDKETGTPFKAAWNRPLKGVRGPSQRVTYRDGDTATDANFLNFNGVGTIIEGNLLWAPFSTATDPTTVGYRSIKRIRTRRAIEKAMLRPLRKYMSEDLGAHLPVLIGRTLEEACEERKSLGAIIGYEVLWSKKLNPGTFLRSGGLRLRLRFEETPDLTDLQIYSEPQPEAFDVLQAAIASSIESLGSQTFRAVA